MESSDQQRSSVGSDDSVRSEPASDVTDPGGTTELSREISTGQSLKSVIFFDHILNFILTENYKPDREIFRIGFKGGPGEEFTQTNIDKMNMKYKLIERKSGGEHQKTNMVIQMKTILEQIKPILNDYCENGEVRSYIVSKKQLENKLNSEKDTLNDITEAYVDSILVEVGAMGEGTDPESTPFILTEEQKRSNRELLGTFSSEYEKLVNSQKEISDKYKEEFKKINITDLKKYIKEIQTILEKNLEKEYVSPDKRNVDEYFFVLFLLFSITSNILKVNMPHGKDEYFKSLTILLKGIYNMDSPRAVLVGGSKKKKTKKKKSKTKKKKVRTKKKKAKTKKKKAKSKKKKSKKKKTKKR
tara:strand:- start:2009 stop:3082 length:1074 start_codon:yes stop_codon:yes gene_type:complete